MQDTESAPTGQLCLSDYARKWVCAIQFVVDKASSLVAVVIGAALVNGIMSATLLWPQAYLYRSRRHTGHRWLFPVLRRAALAVVVCFAAGMCWAKAGR